MKIDNHYTVPKSKLNYWSMLMLIVCFFVSCGTLDKTHKPITSPELVITAAPMVYAHTNHVALDTGRLRSPMVTFTSQSILNPIKTDLQKVSEKVDSSSETLDSLKKILANQNRQTHTIQNMSETITRGNRKIDSLAMALKEEKLMRAQDHVSAVQEKRSAEIKEAGDKTFIFIGHYFPVFASICCIITALVFYRLGQKSKQSHIQVI